MEIEVDLKKTEDGVKGKIVVEPGALIKSITDNPGQLLGQLIGGFMGGNKVESKKKEQSDVKEVEEFIK